MKLFNPKFGFGNSLNVNILKCICTMVSNVSMFYFEAVPAYNSYRMSAIL